MIKIRKAIAAGRFYPNTKDEIDEMIDKCLKKSEKIKIKTKEIIGGILPHAGYIFCLKEAVPFFKILEEKEELYDTVFIINPNHTGYGPDISVDGNDCWETPYLKVELDKEFIEELLIPISEKAQKFEHSGEVLMPLLSRFIKKEFKIVPVNIKNQTYINAKLLAKEIYRANKILNKKILIIASSDFSHYLIPSEGEAKDKLIVDEILNLKSEEIYKKIKKHDISVCGYGAIMTLIEYAKLINKGVKVKNLKNGNSGEILNSETVVFYRSFIFYQ